MRYGFEINSKLTSWVNIIIMRTGHLCTVEERRDTYYWFESEDNRDEAFRCVVDEFKNTLRKLQG